MDFHDFQKGLMVDLPSGKCLQFANWNMAIEIVALPIKNGDVPYSFC